MSWTAAHMIVSAFSSRMIAPSIFESSRSRVAENPTLSEKPPLVTCSTDRVPAQDDEGAGPAAEDAFEAVAQGGAGRDHREDLADPDVRVLFVAHVCSRRDCRGASARESRRAVVMASWIDPTS